MNENGFKENSLIDWTIEKRYGSYVLYGTIYNDTKNRFADGTYIHTSSLTEIDFVNKVAKTKNSTYNLE